MLNRFSEKPKPVQEEISPINPLTIEIQSALNIPGHEPTYPEPTPADLTKSKIKYEKKRTKQT